MIFSKRKGSFRDKIEGPFSPVKFWELECIKYQFIIIFHIFFACSCDNYSVACVTCNGPLRLAFKEEKVAIFFVVKTIGKRKRRFDRSTVIIKQSEDKIGVVVMDKDEYLRLLADASINNATKFRVVDPEGPKSRGRSPKHYYPLLHKEKELESIVRRILPAELADSVRPSGSRLAHLYGLPKTRKEQLAPNIVSYQNIQIRSGEMAR